MSTLNDGGPSAADIHQVIFTYTIICYGIRCFSRQVVHSTRMQICCLAQNLCLWQIHCGLILVLGCHHQRIRERQQQPSQAVGEAQQNDISPTLRHRSDFRREQRKLDQDIRFNGAVYRPLQRQPQEVDWKGTYATDSGTTFAGLKLFNALKRGADVSTRTSWKGWSYMGKLHWDGTSAILLFEACPHRMLALPNLNNSRHTDSVFAHSRRYRSIAEPSIEPWIPQYIWGG